MCCYCATQAEQGFVDKHSATEDPQASAVADKV